MRKVKLLRLNDILISLSSLIEINYEKPTITLIFDELDSYWLDFLNQDLYSFIGVINFNKEQKLIEFEMGYIELNEFAKCSEDHFYINILNNLYYKS